MEKEKKFSFPPAFNTEVVDIAYLGLAAISERSSDVQGRGSYYQVMLRHGDFKAFRHQKVANHVESSRDGTFSGVLSPPAKVTLGLPFYARHTRTGDWKSYEDVLGQTGALEPSVDEAASYAGYYFNGAGLIERKVALARRLGLGGVMIWEVGQDCRVNPVTHGTKTHPSTCPAGEASSLLAAIRRALPAAGDGRAAAANDAPTGRDEL